LAAIDILEGAIALENSNYAKRRKNIKPTTNQAQSAVRVCQLLSSYYQPIIVFRYDTYNKVIYILAVSDRHEIEIVIHPSGFWRFL